MNYEDYNKDDDVLFDDVSDLNQLDFGGKSEDDVEEDMEYVEENLWAKLEKGGKKISFARDIVALYNFMKDPLVRWHRKAIVVAALIYFIVPLDTIPDLTPFFGYLDDLGVITALLKYLGSELKSYYPAGFRVS
jgi:uncharacterized membrane protein YkvA (DUF1232 family)